MAYDPDEAVDAIKPYVDAGFDHLVFHGPGHDQERFLTQFAEDVLPEAPGSGVSELASSPSSAAVQRTRPTSVSEEDA